MSKIFSKLLWKHTASVSNHTVLFDPKYSPLLYANPCVTFLKTQSSPSFPNPTAFALLRGSGVTSNWLCDLQQVTSLLWASSFTSHIKEYIRTEFFKL